MPLYSLRVFWSVWCASATPGAMKLVVVSRDMTVVVMMRFRIGFLSTVDMTGVWA